MRKCLLVIALLSMCACTMAPLMRDADFDSIAVGGKIHEIESIYGEPYEVTDMPNGMQEYRYVQRIDCGTSSYEITEYIFSVCQGKIVGKNRRLQGSPSFQICQ